MRRIPRSTRYAVEKKRTNYAVIDTTVEGKRGREVDSFNSKKEALQKCRDYNRYQAEYEEGTKD